MEMNEKELFHEIRMPWSDNVTSHLLAQQTDRFSDTLYSPISGMFWGASSMKRPRPPSPQVPSDRGPPRHGSDSRTRFHGGVISPRGSARRRRGARAL